MLASNSEERFIKEVDGYKDTLSNVVLHKDKYGFLEDSKQSNKDIIQTTGASMKLLELIKPFKKKVLTKEQKVVGFTCFILIF